MQRLVVENNGIDDDDVDDHNLDDGGVGDGGDAGQLDRYCQIVGVWERTECRSRNTRCEAVEVALQGWEGAQRPEALLAQCVARLLGRVLSGRRPPLRIGMSCQPPTFASPYHIPHRSPEQNTPEAMAAELERLAVQSAGGVDLFGGTVLFRISAVWPLSTAANGRSGDGACAVDEQQARGTVRCRSFVPVVNPDDRWCLARAIVIGLADRRFQQQYGAGTVQAAAQFRAFCLAQRGHAGAHAAQQLLQLAALPCNLLAYGIAEAQRVQDALDRRLGAHKVRLVLFEREHGCRVLWKGTQRAQFNLCLLLQQSAHYGYIQRPAQLVHAKQFCVECEHPVDRRSHPLGCRAVCGLCLRYDGLQFPCTRRAGEDQSGLRCAHCRFVFPNAECMAAHRRRVDPLPPGGADALQMDRRSGRPHRSMCEERRICEACNVVVWARSGPHTCGGRSAAGAAATETTTTRAISAAAAAAAALPHHQQQQQQQQQAPQCEKCGGPHDPRWTPHFIQPKKFACQIQWHRDGSERSGDAGDACSDNDDVDDDDDDGGVGAIHIEGRRERKPLRFIFWDVECAQERVDEDEAGGAVEQQQQQQPQSEARITQNDDDDNDVDRVEAAAAATAPLLKHVPVLVCAEVICERCVAYGVELEREPMRRAPRCICGVPWRGANRRRWCARIGEDKFDDSQVDAAGQPQQIPPDGLNPRRLRFFCDSEQAAGTGRGALAQFVDFLLHTGPKGICTVMLAHNGGRYDIHLLLEELQRRGERPRKVIQHGLRVYALELRGNNQRQLICKDSLNYFHCALGALPDTFGLHGVPSKPFFPYHYIHACNLDVEMPAGVLPPPSAYDPDRMRHAQREQFLEWYAQERDRPGRQPFLLRRELLRYCWNDVRILRSACLQFRELVGECADGMEPFLASSTIASLAMAVFRQAHLRRDTMVQTPEGGFLRGRHASVASRRFFALLQLLRPDLGPVQSAQWSIGEACMDDNGFRLDGIVYRPPPLRPLCIEYNGCYAHGCMDCYPQRQMKLAGGNSAELLLARTQLRAWELSEHHGLEVQTVWECQFKRTLRSNARVRKVYTERCCTDVPGPLDLRKHALFGGRVEPFYLLYACVPEEEELVYIDIVSLYPYCMKTRGFPIGLPHVWTHDQLWPDSDHQQQLPPQLRPAPLPWRSAEDNCFTGFVLCRVLPPTPAELGPHEPLLPYRTRADGRLTFGLCARCCEQRQQKRCRHAVHERAWTSAYTHVELNRALALGYQVLDVYEVWHYDAWASAAEGNGLFTDYVNTFLKLKAEASGWPVGCDSDVQRADHLRRFRAEHGVDLRVDHVRHNPGMRQLAKDLLNALWGKMAERPERDNVEYTSTARAFHQLMTNPSQEVVSFTHINDKMDRCVVRKREPFARAPEHNNLAVACFVTSHARLCLFDWLEEVRRVGGRVVYCDTDSVLYVKRRGAAGVREGNALGDMKREFPGRRIVDFFAAGPKNYGFMHVDERTGGGAKAERKVRSFELNYETGKLLQYERMRQLVINHFGRRARPHSQRSIAVPCHRFVRNRRADIYTLHNTRVYRPVYTKGRVIRTAGEQPDMHQEDNGQQQQQAGGPVPMFFRTRPFGWYAQSEEEEEENNAGANDDDDDGGNGNLSDQAMEVECSVSEAVSAPSQHLRAFTAAAATAGGTTHSTVVVVEEEAEEEPVPGCSAWNQEQRQVAHLTRHNC